MNNKSALFKRMSIISSVAIMAALFLTACNGAISFQGSVNPNDQGGISVSGGAQPQPTQSAGGTTLDSSTIILIGIAIFVLVLILILLVGRRPSNN